MIEALYLHIPFCVKRCAYCDFATRACSDDALMDAYVDALSLQVRRASHAGLLGGVRTIYIGGGTPTHMGARRLNSLVYLLSLSVNLENVREFTLECNPESLTQPMVKDLFALGVDRFSIGAQSFDDAVLQQYGRVHDAAAIERAVGFVKERTDNFSLDLICGGPCQSMESWERSVQAALATGARHVSIYPLTIEGGTPLAARIDAGEWEGPDDDLEADMMQRASELLQAAGMHRYEVASYAFDGYESQHNTAYWTGVEYLGLGAGASSMLSGDVFGACADAGVFGEFVGESGGAYRVRVAADADSEAFAASNGHPAAELELLVQREAALEDLMLGFRRSAGVSEQQVSEVARMVPELADAISRLEQQGLVCSEGRRYRPTERGWLMGNELYGAIWDLA